MGASSVRFALDGIYYLSKLPAICHIHRNAGAKKVREAPQCGLQVQHSVQPSYRHRTSGAHRRHVLTATVRNPGDRVHQWGRARGTHLVNGRAGIEGREQRVLVALRFVSVKGAVSKCLVRFALMERVASWRVLFGRAPLLRNGFTILLRFLLRTKPSEVSTESIFTRVPKSEKCVLLVVVSRIVVNVNVVLRIHAHIHRFGANKSHSCRKRSQVKHSWEKANITPHWEFRIHQCSMIYQTTKAQKWSQPPHLYVVWGCANAICERKPSNTLSP